MLLDLSHSGAITALRTAGVEEVKVAGHGSGQSGKERCLWRQDQVKGLAEERQSVARLKANGFRWCVGCVDWKRQTEFAPTAHRCRACMRVISKAAWAQNKRQRSRITFANRNAERLSGSVESYIGQIKPAAPADALQYACMDVGYHHRPLPVQNGRRISKREAYCQICMAKGCMHHRELTPKQIVERWKKWGK